MLSTPPWVASPLLGLTLRAFARQGLLFLLPMALPAQTEIFGSIGVMCHGNSDLCGASQNAISFGGGLTRPLIGGFVVEADVQTSYFAREDRSDSFWRNRKTILLGNVLYRWGGARRYVFAGTGLGVEHVHTLWREDGFAEDYMLGPTERYWTKVRDGVFGGDHRYNEFVWFAPRGGFTVYPTKRFGVRVEFYMARYNSGLRSSVVYRIE